MGKTKHEKTYVDFDKPYEQNLIGMRGIVFFGIGLFLLIVVTFGLMAAMQNVMEEQASEWDREAAQPLTLRGDELLPPEPRLQGAPGFGVDTKTGRVNLELTAPQSEYWELKKQWDSMLLEGQKALDKDNREVIVTLPIGDAKRMFLEQNATAPQSRPGEMTDQALEEANTFYSYSSAGRTRTDRRR
jgi:hypothetical protein